MIMEATPLVKKGRRKKCVRQLPENFITLDAVVVVVVVVVVLNYNAIVALFLIVLLGKWASMSAGARWQANKRAN